MSKSKQEQPLTLPGDIPGLLRRGSPVLFRDEVGDWTVLCVEDHEVCAAPVGEVPLGLWGMSDDFALDLSERTGRFHALYWLGLQPTQYGTNWPGLIASARPVVAEQMRGVTGPGRLFEDLDPDDPRTLRDGSRWVDAEALRRIVLHIAGRESTP